MKRQALSICVVASSPESAPSLLFAIASPLLCGRCPLILPYLCRLQKVILCLTLCPLFRLLSHLLSLFSIEGVYVYDGNHELQWLTQTEKIVPLTAAVIVTTPQKLSFIDVAKGVRMFSKLKVPCVAVVENMCHFDADGKRYYPFGRGSGSEVVQQFGIPHLFDMPIRPTLSASGDSGMPEVVADPQGEASKIFQDLGVCVVQQCAKIRQQVSTAVTYDRSIKAIKVKVPDSDEEFFLHPATVRRNDRSAQSVDEWTGEQKLQYTDVPEDIEPEEIRPMGNYAVSITWPDGFSQIAPYDQLQTIERLVDIVSPTVHA